MAFKERLVLLVLAVIITVSAVSFLTYKKEKEYKVGLSEEADKAVNQAQALYNQKKGLIDFSKGLCLTNDLMNKWVVDIVHSPRIPEDDKVENQCSAYLEGRAKHFVELDTKGNVVRVQ